MTLESRLNKQLELNLRLLDKRVKRLVLSFSGGLDSCVLLDLLSRLNNQFDITVWHINHGLLDNADEMAAFCKNIADQYRFDFKVSHLALDSTGANIEATAREARYAVFEQALGNTDSLLTAHHADDQAETFFLNALRGSGVAGLRGIATIKSLADFKVLRPLLNVNRAELAQYADIQPLKWFTDPSNSSDKFDRNYLRNRCMPLIRKRWPSYLESIKSVCSIQGETQQLLEELGEEDYLRTQISSRFYGAKVDCQQLQRLSVGRQKNMIRFWLRQQGLLSLPQTKLNELLRQIMMSHSANLLIQTRQYEFRVYQDYLYLCPNQFEGSINESYPLLDGNRLEIKAIQFNQTRQAILTSQQLKDTGQTVTLRFRTESIANNSYAHRLKRMFQKAHVPPWLRSRIPQVYVDDELIGLWIK